MLLFFALLPTPFVESCCKKRFILFYFAAVNVFQGAPGRRGGNTYSGAFVRPSGVFCAFGTRIVVVEPLFVVRDLFVLSLLSCWEKGMF